MFENVLILGSCKGIGLEMVKSVLLKYKSIKNIIITSRDEKLILIIKDLL